MPCFSFPFVPPQVQHRALTCETDSCGVVAAAAAAAIVFGVAAGGIEGFITHLG